MTTTAEPGIRTAKLATVSVSDHCCARRPVHVTGVFHLISINTAFAMDNRSDGLEGRM